MKVVQLLNSERNARLLTRRVCHDDGDHVVYASCLEFPGVIVTASQNVAVTRKSAQHNHHS